MKLEDGQVSQCEYWKCRTILNPMTASVDPGQIITLNKRIKNNPLSPKNKFQKWFIGQHANIPLLFKINKL